MDFKKIILLIFSIHLFGCKHENTNSVDYVMGPVEKTSKEFVIPRTLKDAIEKEYLAFIRKENIKIVLPDSELLARIPREFLDVDLFFRSSAPGVLTDHTQFSLPRGGGEIDLKNMVKGTKGSFYLTYKVKRTREQNAPIKGLHVYFLSEYETRRIDGETYGVGCRRYMDVTPIFEVANKTEGVQFNVTGGRYLPVIGGTLYFIDFDPDRKMFISAIRIIDSRFPNERCPDAR